MSAATSLLSGPIVSPINGHSYYITSATTWNDAQNLALSIAGNLATVRSVEENNWIYSTFTGFGGENYAFWIGLNDRVQEGQFVWISGESSAFVNWGPGSPDNNGPLMDEDFVHIIPSITANAGRWGDLSSDAAGYRGGSEPSWDSVGLKFSGVIEVIPEPSVSIFSGLAIFAVTLKRRR